MISKVLHSILKVLVCITFCSIHAQQKYPLPLNEQLPQSFVSGIIQDKQGFIWISTRNGLARYDGRQLKTFQSQPGNTATLASNIIATLKIDAKNNIWIEYESGAIDIFNPETENIKHFITEENLKTNNISFLSRAWIPDSDSVFWAISPSKEIFSLTPTKKTTHYTTASGLQTNNIVGITEDRQGQLWVLTQKGLSKFDKTSKSFLPVINFNLDIPNPKSNNDYITLHQRKNGELMWGDQKTLYFFNHKKSTLRKKQIAPHSEIGIKWMDTDTNGTDFFQVGNGIYSYDDKQGLKLIGNTENNNNGNTISFLVDNSGVIWLGTTKTGIHQIDLSNHFRTFPYKNTFAIDLLDKFSPNTGSLFNWKTEDELFSLSGYNLRSAYDKKGELYIALKETVARYDANQKRFVKLPLIPSPVGYKLQIPIKGITFNNKNEPIVILSNGSIIFYDFLKEKWENFIPPSTISQFIGTKLEMRDIYADDTRIWMTTSEKGLLYLDIKTRKINHIQKGKQPFALPSNNLLAIKQDLHQKDILWIGSYQGLIRFNKNTLELKTLTTKDGLPDNTVYDIQIDKSGYLWLSSNKGLCRFAPSTFKTRTFTISHGLQGNEFNRFHSLKFPDGRIAFGGTKGWTIFDPLAIKDDNFNTPIALTDLKINNKKQSLLSSPVNKHSKINLSYDENTLSITFAGLEFNQPEDLQYRYQLEGFDKEWILNGNNNEAVYTKVPPGNYTFKVNASNSTGKWSNTFKTLEITIHPPWWQTIPAYITYILLILLAIIGYIKYRLKQELIKQEIVLKEREAAQLKELDAVKTRFFANITHEFRTPLTLISGPAEQLLQHPEKDKHDNLVNTIAKNAQQLLQLTNQLMDLAKLEAKAMKPQLVKGNITLEINTVVETFQEEANRKNITLTFLRHDEDHEHWFSAEMLERILYNLISNAIKFTPSGGTIVIQHTENEKGIRLTIKDTGKGIPPDELPHIFDRFYQANNTWEEPSSKKQSGTGIGLALVKELVDLQNGTIEAQNYNDIENHTSGVVFTVFLPYQRAKKEHATETQIPVTDNQEEDSLLPLLLLVEDNTELTLFIKESLPDSIRIITAGNGLVALEMAVEIIPDLIVSDVLMPEMDGFTLCNQLKKDDRTSHIPIILLTAKADFESKMEGLSYGADDYLTKPFHVAELVARVNNFIEQQRKLREFIQKNQGQLPEDTNNEPEIQNIFLNKLYNIIELNLEDPLFGVEETVQAIHISRTSLHRKLKSLTGMTTTEVIRAYRLKRAIEFLRQGFNINETAYKVGFNSPAYFTKSFKEVYGKTPSDYLKNIKE